MASRKAATAKPVAKVEETIEESTETAEAVESAATAKPESLLVRYHVSGNLASIGFGDEVYVVKDHTVELPPGALWYAHLVENKTLVQE